MYESSGTDVFVVCSNGERDRVAFTESADVATEAARILSAAGRANDRRRYTESARGYARAEMLPGFSWVDSDENDVHGR